jgi:cytochrome c
MLALLAGAAFSANVFAAADAAAAKALMKKEDCFKCHAEDKTKKAASYKKIADKYKGKADADAKMFEHLTTTPKVKLEDGTEEEHKALDKKDADKIKNVIQWIRER